MRRLALWTLAGLLLVSSAGVSFAWTRSPGINARQWKQNKRIDQGVNSGELTRKETKKLRAEQKVIKFEERVFKSDGHLGFWERKRLHRDLNRASRDIYRQKHDEQKR
jgi:hypothetical protein